MSEEEIAPGQQAQAASSQSSSGYPASVPEPESQDITRDSTSGFQTSSGGATGTSGTNIESNTRRGSRTSVSTRRTSTTSSPSGPILPLHDSPPPVQPHGSFCGFTFSCHRICFFITYPIMVIISIIGLIMMLIFCVMPTLIGMSIGICFYYCFHSEPIPLPLLLRSLFANDNMDQRARYGGTAFQGDVDNAEWARVTRKVYRSKIIVRRLLSVETIPSPPKVATSGKTNDERNHDSEIILGMNSKRPVDVLNLRSKSPIVVQTEHKYLHFSAPLDPPTKESDDDSDSKPPDGNESEDTDAHVDGNGNDATEYVPHYQRSSENEVANRNLRELIPPAEDSRSSIERNAASSNLSLSDDANESQADSGTGSSNNGFLTVKIQGGSNVGSIIDESDDEGDRMSDKDASACGIKNPPIRRDYFGIEEDARDMGTACDICILEFEVGDEIAWSPNTKCSHAFHKDCILDWLVRKPTCPNCRQDFINANNTDDNA